MAFIRKRRTSATGVTYSLIEAYRQPGVSPRQRLLANLGPCKSLEERIVSLIQEAAELPRRRGAADLEQRRERFAWLKAELEKLERVRDELATRVDKRFKVNRAA
jgi:hypothetical protein